jgi:UDP-N-acetylglucosamine/UDP-N-acetylgalactosamine diphosphorylase
MLAEEPIFLGGLAGVVGPARLGFGSVLAAGGVYRADYDEGLLVLGERRRDGSTAFRPRSLGSIRAKVSKNVLYVAELTALWAWYRHVRPRLAGSDPLAHAVVAAGLGMVEANIEERVKQLDRFRELVRESMPDPAGGGGDAPLAGEWRQFAERWDDVRPILQDFRQIEGRAELRDEFCGRLVGTPPGAYTAGIQGLTPADRRLGSAWLRSIADGLVDRCRAALPLITS